MNKKMIIYILGKMLGVEGALLLIPALVSLIYGEKTGVSFLIVAAVLGVISALILRKYPIHQKERQEIRAFLDQKGAGNAQN